MKNILCSCIGCLNGSECQNTLCPSPWQGFNLFTRKYVPPNLEAWMSCTVCKNILSVLDTNYWAEHIHQMSGISVFKELQDYIQWNPLPHLNANIDIIMS